MQWRNSSQIVVYFWNFSIEMFCENGQSFLTTFVHLPTSQTCLHVWKVFCIIHQKPQPNFSCLSWQKTMVGKAHIVCFKQTIPHQFTLTLKGVCWLLKSNPDGARSLYWSISSSIPRAKANLPQLLIFLTFLKKTCHIVILKVVRCSKLLIGFTQTFSKA